MKISTLISRKHTPISKVKQYPYTQIEVNEEECFVKHCGNRTYICSWNVDISDNVIAVTTTKEFINGWVALCAKMFEYCVNIVTDEVRYGNIQGTDWKPILKKSDIPSGKFFKVIAEIP